MASSNAARESLMKMASRITFWLVLNIVLLLALLGTELSSHSKPSWWQDGYSVTMNLAAGGLVSFFFYWLVVYVPEQRKRRIIKDNLAQMYKSIKKDILYQVVFASVRGGRRDLQADQGTIAKLMTTDGFKAAFEGGRQADEGFYAFENQMSYDTPEFRQIILYFEMLAKQIEFVLYNYTMDDENLFDFFKRFEIMLLSLNRSNPWYDESKPLCRFVYEIFAGWNPVDGYRGYDIIDKMITDI